MINTTNPYQVGVADSPILHPGSINDQLKIIKQDEEQSKAPPILPNPLDKINPILSNIFVSLIQIREMLNQAKLTPRQDEARIAIIQDKIDNINKEILDLPTYLATISL